MHAIYDKSDLSSPNEDSCHTATLCDRGDGHLVHIMAYIFQCTQTTKWKPSNLALLEWEVQQFNYAQKEPHDLVAPHEFVKILLELLNPYRVFTLVGEDEKSAGHGAVRRESTSLSRLP